jgi:hypothetical protein
MPRRFAEATQGKAHMNVFEDPGFLGGVVGAGAALVGAVIGSAATYWAAKAQYITEYNYKKWDALRAVLIELYTNQPMLALDLDRSLPAWLARAHRSGDATSLRKLEGYIQQTRHYESSIYNALFADLVATRFGSELAIYYRRLAWLNEWTSKATQRDIDRDFDSYILGMANAILVADDLVPQIAQEIGKSPVKTLDKNFSLDDFMKARQRPVFMAELSKFDLRAVEEMLGGRPSRQSPKTRAAIWSPTSGPRRWHPSDAEVHVSDRSHANLQTTARPTWPLAPVTRIIVPLHVSA